MLILDELVAAEREAGDLDRALADALELKRRMWAIHRRQTGQVVEQVWARAALEQERRSLEAQTAAAIRSAEEDALTRIGNRRLIERVLGDVAENTEPLALLMADIDHFKRINDTFGHEVGDHVLRALGHILASDARAGQIVVRYGGEEFVFALPVGRAGAARDFAERIRIKVRSYPWGQPGPPPGGDRQHRRGVRAGGELAFRPGRGRPCSLPGQAAGPEPGRSGPARRQAHGLARGRAAALLRAPSPVSGGSVLGAPFFGPCFCALSARFRALGVFLTRFRQKIRRKPVSAPRLGAGRSKSSGHFPAGSPHLKPRHPLGDPHERRPAPPR